MGIENLRSTSNAGTRCAGSLPLMGIENSRARGLCRGCVTAHYPSWGLKTAAAAPCIVTQLPSHYPSWGLKTTRTVAQLEAWAVHSLPLMGIENPDRQSTPLPFPVSLPLMGIENSADETAYVGAVTDLITPHGD